MSLPVTILYKIAKIWPSPKSVKSRDNVYDKDYHMKYALQNQYLLKLSQGLRFKFYNKDLLEIGCGHGGISTLMAVSGARRVVGIDINKENLVSARAFAQKQSERLQTTNLPVEFMEMSAYEMTLDEESMDVVLADNVFEHFMEPRKVLEQSHKVLRKGGKLVVPIFSSIYSKYALHLKVGLKVPWTNLIFSEKNIVKALYRLAEDNPTLFDAYPGLKDKPKYVRDVRRYGDLNDITYPKFRKMSKEVGFEVESFQTVAPKRLRIMAAIIRKIPGIRNSLMADVFSTGASAVLVKK